MMLMVPMVPMLPMVLANDAHACVFFCLDIAWAPTYRSCAYRETSRYKIICVLDIGLADSSTYTKTNSITIPFCYILSFSFAIRCSPISVELGGGAPQTPTRMRRWNIVLVAIQSCP